MESQLDRITDVETLRGLVNDFDELLGLDGNFWNRLGNREAEALDSPEQLHDLAKDLLVELFGLEVRGL